MQLRPGRLGVIVQGYIPVDKVQDVKLALWQTEGNPAKVAANLAALEPTARAAAGAGAALLVCPECWLCGYNIGQDVKALAEDRHGPSARRIAAIAQQNQLAIAYGYAERDPETDSIYNSVQVIGPDARPLAHYRKTHLFGPDERAVYRPGGRLEPPFRFGDFSIGLLICYDVEFPEAVRSLALLGADVILVPTALSEEYVAVADTIVPARSVENQVFIAYCNHAGMENGLRFLGHSRLTSVDGTSLAAADRGEALLIGEISASVRDATAKLFPYRADRRPELYGLLAVG
jgi:5-aminopentanamidase